MAVINDYTKSSKAIIVDLINKSQTPEGAITEASVLLGAASANTTNPGTDGDTKLTVTGVIAEGLKGEVVVTYNRVPAADIPGARQKSFEKGTFTKVSQLLPQINARYGVNIAADEIVDADLPALTTDPVAFNLVFVAGSLVFTGTLALEVTPDATDIEDIIAVKVLDGLVYTPPV